jgi:hypothetical protein
MRAKRLVYSNLASRKLMKIWEEMAGSTTYKKRFQQFFEYQERMEVRNNNIFY